MTGSPSTKSWASCPSPKPNARLRLFCFPYAGGGAAVYRPWAARLPADVELWLVHLPGRESRLPEPPINRLDPLVAALTPALRPMLDRPFAFFGHSMGGLICFEVARALRRQGGPLPQHLCISASRAPHLPDPHPAIHALPEAEFMVELRELEGTPTEVLDHPELMQLMLPLLRADFALYETFTYRDETALDCPITVFGAWQDREVTKEELDAWAKHTTTAFRLQMFPGGHFFLQDSREPLLQALSQALASH